MPWFKCFSSLKGLGEEIYWRSKPTFNTRTLDSESAINGYSEQRQLSK